MSEESHDSTATPAPRRRPEAAPSAGASSSGEEELLLAMRRMFVNVTDFVQGELQVTSGEYEMLEKMNLRAAAEYRNFGDFASGMSVFMATLRAKNGALTEYLKQVDEIDKEITHLEAVVSTLDSYTRNLESKLKTAM